MCAAYQLNNLLFFPFFGLVWFWGGGVIAVVLQFGTRDSAAYEAFAQAIESVISLKRAGKRSSIQHLVSDKSRKASVKVFEVTMNGQGSIGLNLAVTAGGFPVATSKADTSVQHGVCRDVLRGDIVHKINGSHTESQSFDAIIEKLRRTRPLTIEFVRCRTLESAARFFGDAAINMKF